MPKSIKILFLNNSDIHGGAARAAFRIMTSLRDLEVNTKMLVRNKASNDPDVISSDIFMSHGLKGRVNRFIWKVKNRLRKQKWKKYPNREKVFLNDLNSISLSKALNSIDYDVLYLHFVAHEFLNLNELKKIKKPIVWTLHDCWPFTGICHYFYDCTHYKNKCGKCQMLKSDNPKDFTHKIWKIKNKIYKKCNLHIVTPSNWLAEAARESSLFKQLPITVIPNGIDTNIFKPFPKINARQKLNLNENIKYILFGAINAINDRNKGFHLLDKSIEVLCKAENSSIELIVFGAKTNIILPNSNCNITNLGIINDDNLLTLLYSAADVTVVPSLTENLSCAIMESLSCGTPVVGFNIGGNSDMITHKHNGYLAEPYSTKDFANGIKWCLLNNQNCELSINAREKVLEYFKIETISKKYYELFKNLTAIK